MIDRPTRPDGRPSLRSELVAALDNDDSDTRELRGLPPAARRAHLLSLRADDSREDFGETVSLGLADPAVIVRHAALEACGRDRSLSARLLATLGQILRSDPSAECREAAAFAIGESGRTGGCEIIVDVIGDEESALVREAVVAAIGALACPGGLDELIDRARSDKPSVRRRAVVALTAFDDGRAQATIVEARADRDRYVRETAEWLLRPL